MNARLPIVALCTIVTAFVLSGCSSAYYGAMEKIGIPKRELVVKRVGEAREAQQEAKEQFADALQKFLAVTRVEGGELQRKYDQLSTELKQSKDRANEVRERVAGVKDVSEALFSEWKRELGQYSDQSLRAESERQLKETRRRYDDLMASMKRAAERMDPILKKFDDQVLFLKHNLNARAIAGLTATARTLEDDISRLIADMEKSIREADEFIKAMNASG